jgi:hypothetical protein
MTPYIYPAIPLYLNISKVSKKHRYKRFNDRRFKKIALNNT